jgi:hypothetical protein
VNPNSPHGREWRQFRVLSQDSVRQLLNAAVMSRGTDPMILAIWVGAFILAPPTITSIRLLMTYSGAPSYAALEPLLFQNRMFFLVYGMFAAALIAVVVWEALFPNQTDQEALGSLPVRPRTVAAARLTAALLIVLTASAALAVPSAVLFTLTSLASPTPWIFPVITVTHFAVMCGGPLFIFTAFLVVRGLVAVIFGAGVAERMAVVLQLAAVVALIETLLYAPVVGPFLMAQKAGGPWSVWLPPVWFASLYDALVGPVNIAAPRYAWLAGAALIASLTCATLVYLLPARLVARRALESQSRRRAGRLALLVHMTTRLLRLQPATASLYEFTVVSLARSPRHLVVVAGYLGAGIGLGAMFVLTAGFRNRLEPSAQDATLMFPLVLIFTVTFGLRSAFNIPTDLAAHWPFRLLEPAMARATAAARLAMMTLGILPIMLLTMVVALAAGWPWQQVLAVGVFDLLLGAMLVEIVLYGWPKIPFACAHPPDAGAVQVKWLLWLVALNVFAARGADFQLVALGSLQRTLIFAAILLGVVVALQALNYREGRRLSIEFDGPPESSMQALNLSEALR